MSTLPESNHINAYKSRGERDQQNQRRRRQDNAVQLRKNKREENLAKRRNINICSSDLLEGDSSEIKENIGNQNDLVSASNIDSNIADLKNFNTPQPVMPLDEIVKGILSNMQVMETNPSKINFTQLHKSVQHCRKMLSREKKPPIDQIIEAGLVPYLSELLLLDLKCKTFMHSGDANYTDIIYSTIFEAAWALTNICSGTSEQTHQVVQVDALPKFIRLLNLTSHLNIVEQAAWALGNIAGDGADLRDKVLSEGVLKPLLELLDFKEATNTFLQNTTWTLSNLCRNKNPPTKLEHVRELLPGLVKLLKHKDRQIKTDACWAMSYLTDGTNDRIDTVLQYNALTPLVELLANNKDLSVITPVLRSIGNIVTGTDQQTQKVIDTGSLACFQNLLKHEKSSIQKEAAWTLSNITAGTPDQIQAVIAADLIEPIMNCLRLGDAKTKKESVWVVTNFTSGGTSQQVSLLCQAGAIEGLCNMLSCNEDRTTQVILDGIQNILIHAEKLGYLESGVELIEECGGLDAIEKLQSSQNDQIYQAAYRIIDTYFCDDGEDGVVDDVVNQNKDGEIMFKGNGEKDNGGKAFQF